MTLRELILSISNKLKGLFMKYQAESSYDPLGSMTDTFIYDENTNSIRRVKFQGITSLEGAPVKFSKLWEIERKSL